MVVYTRSSYQASAIAQEAIDDIRSMMRSKGYKSKTSRQSSLYTNVFTKGDRTITVDGWHGMGNYGPDKAVLSLYDSSCTNPFHRVCELDNTEFITEGRARSFTQQVVSYLHSKA